MQRRLFNIDRETARTIGGQAIDAMIHAAQPMGDCAVCGRQLGTAGKFSLLVQDSDPILVVGIAHAPCLSPRHQATQKIGLGGTTYRIRTLMVDGIGMIMVNPGIDVFTLVRSRPGAPYEHDPLGLAESFGWVDPVKAKKLQHCCTYTLEGLSLTVNAPFGTWKTIVEDGLAELLTQKNRNLSVLITDEPVDDITGPAAFDAILRSGKCRIGIAKPES